MSAAICKSCTCEHQKGDNCNIIYRCTCGCCGGKDEALAMAKDTHPHNRVELVQWRADGRFQLLTTIIGAQKNKETIERRELLIAGAQVLRKAGYYQLADELQSDAEKL